MILQYSPFVIPLLVAGVITGLLALLTLRRRGDPVIPPFILLMCATTVWTFGYAVQLASADLPTNLLITALVYPAIVTVPVAWLLVVLCYTGHDHLLSLRNIALLLAEPAFAVALVATNGYHYLYYTAYLPGTLAGAAIWNFVHGPLFWVHAGYAYLCIGIAFVLILQWFIASPAIYRRQIALLALAAGIPLAANLAYVFGLNPLRGLDITPFMFTATGVLMAIGITRFRLFSLAPVAYPLIFTAIDDAVIVLDRHDLVSDLNPAAWKIVRAGSRPVGEPAARVLPPLIADIPACDGPEEGTIRHAVIAGNDGVLRDYDVTCRTIRNRVGGYGGRLFVLRDVTEKRKAQVAIERANRKLNLLSSITRHDMQNKLTALGGFLQLAQAEKDPLAVQRHLAAMGGITRVFQGELEFTRDYQDLGVKEPVWQDVEEMVRGQAAILRAGDVRVAVGIRPTGVEIYADLLLEKVFFNLLDNAIRYGGENLTEIRVGSREENRALIIVFADNGTGIPAEDKPRLFVKGFGRNTGLGLFLSQEILSITGIAIAENGVPGQGARFVITVPEGMYRVRKDGPAKGPAAPCGASPLP